MTDPQDQAELRLRAADPAGQSRALPPPRIEHAELLEGIMSTTTGSLATAPAPAPRWSRPRWLLAAAAVVAIAAGGTAVGLTVGSGSSDHAKTVKTLALPKPAGPGIGNTCIRFTIDILRDKPVAFDGTVSEVTDNDVLLTVNHWYKGGTADEVRLTSSQSLRLALEGTVDFTVGQRYLVTATDGTVNYCGYTAAWSADMERSFQEAFGS
jgi:hypothetical protein